MNQSLESLAGKELGSVTFIRDYLQLGFDGQGLTMLVWPTIEVSGVKLRYGMPGYRDALCERISKTVNGVSLVEDNELTIQFDDGSILCMSMKPEDYPGPEFLMFYDGPNLVGLW